MIEATLEDLQLELWYRLRNSEQLIWETKEEKKIPIKNLELSHLVNIISMLKRKELKLKQEEDFILEDLRGLTMDNIC